MEVAGAHEKGLRYLQAAKRLTSVARLLDDDDATEMRLLTDKLIQKGLKQIMDGARELAVLIRERRASDSANDQG